MSLRALLVLGASVLIGLACSRRAEPPAVEVIPPKAAALPAPPNGHGADPSEVAIGPLPKDVVEAWANAGAIAGWYGTGTGGRAGFSYRQYRQFGKNTPPTFCVSDWKKDVVRGLPAPQAAFAIYFNSAEIADADLTELKRFDRLVALNLRNTAVTDAGMKELARLERLVALDLGYTKVSDAGLKELTTLIRLTSLCLDGTGVTDAGFKELARFERLAVLGLSGTDITNEGLEGMAGLKSLKDVNLYGMKLTPEGLKHLARLKWLTHIRLAGTMIKKKAIDELQKELPGCTIEYDSTALWP